MLSYIFAVETSLAGFPSTFESAKTVGANFHPSAQRISITFRLISSYPKQQLANPSHHGLNHIQHLWPWFTIPLHAFQATNLLFMTHTRSPLPLTLHSHTPLRLPGFEASLFTIKCALQCSVKIKRYQREYGFEMNGQSPIKSPVWPQWFFSTVNGNISPPFQNWDRVTVHNAKVWLGIQFLKT